MLFFVLKLIYTRRHAPTVLNPPAAAPDITIYLKSK